MPYIKKEELINSYEGLRKCDLSELKSYNQQERRAILTMLRTLENNEKGATIDSLPEIKEVVSVQPSSLIERIIKFVLNLLHLRVSSAQLQKEIDFIETYGTKERYHTLKPVIQLSANLIEETNLKMQKEKDFLLKTISRKEDIEELEGGHVSQFKTDYTRAGIVVTISDSEKGVFQGKDKTEAVHKNDHFLFHTEGFEKIFDPTEKKWMHLAECNSVQTPFNNIGIPLSTKFMEEIKNYSLDDVNYRLDVTLNEKCDRFANINVLRDQAGKITGLDVNHTMYTEVILKDDLRKHDPITVGYVKSFVGYSVSFKDDGKTPKIENYRFKHTFSERPFSNKKGVEPGYHSVRKEEEKIPETDAEKLTQQWSKELSRLKLDTKPTAKKVKWLKGRISDIERVLPHVMGATSLKKDAMNIILDNYKKYLNQIT